MKNPHSVANYVNANDYDYDKTIKSKTKDIQSLEAQKAALEGVETAEAKAKKAKLQADLADQKEELNDTINEHLFDLSQDALDDLKDVLQDAFDDKWDAISGDLESITNLMAAANELAASSANTISSTLNEILKYYGIDPVATGIQSAVGYASGKKRVDKDHVAITQEDGTEAIMLPDGSILTPLQENSTVFDADRTNNLWKWGEISPANVLDNIKNPILDIPINPEGRSISMTQNYDSLLKVEGNVDSTVVTDLKQFAKQFYKGSYEYTVKEIGRDARKVGIKV